MVCKNNIVVTFVLVLVFGVSIPSFAARKIYSPIVEGKGEWEIETTGVYDFDSEKEKNALQEYKNSIGYGVTERWFTELLGEFEREREDDNASGHLAQLKYTNLEWENRYQLTEQGQYWLDAGLYLAYEIPMREKNSGKIEAKILLEKPMVHFLHTINISFEKEVGGGWQNETEASLALRSRYHWHKFCEPGIEYYIGFGELNEHLPYRDQNHQVGPVIAGQLTDHIKYDIGYLFGISPSAPEGELKWIGEYEWHF